MNTGGAGRASLGPIRAERRYISMFEWSGMAWGLEGLYEAQKHMTTACCVCWLLVSSESTGICVTNDPWSAVTEHPVSPICT